MNRGIHKRSTGLVALVAWIMQVGGPRYTWLDLLGLGVGRTACWISTGIFVIRTCVSSQHFFFFRLLACMYRCTPNTCIILWRHTWKRMPLYSNNIFFLRLHDTTRILVTHAHSAPWSIALAGFKSFHGVIRATITCTRTKKKVVYFSRKDKKVIRLN